MTPPPSSLRCIISMLKVWKGGAFAKPPFKDFSDLFQVGAVATTPLKLFAKWVVSPPPLLSLSHHKAYLGLVICTPPPSLSLLRHYNVCLWGVCFRFQPFKNSNTGSLLYNGLRVLAPPPSLPPSFLPFTIKSCLRREKVGVVSHVSQCTLLSRFGNTENLLKFQEGFLSFAVQRWEKWSILKYKYNVLHVPTVLSGRKWIFAYCLKKPRTCFYFTRVVHVHYTYTLH